MHGDMRNTYKISVGKPSGKNKAYMERCNQMDLVSEFGLDSSGSGLLSVVGVCEHRNETYISMKCCVFI
jgi:hypothetical protein